MSHPNQRFPTFAIAFAIALLVHPLGGAIAQEQMGPGMMNQGTMGQGMMGQGMMGQGMMGPGMMGPGMMGPESGCPFMADGSMMGSGMMRHRMMGHHGGAGSGMMGMMGQGMMGQGMMRHGMMQDGMAGQRLVMRPAPPLLTVADVTYNLERLLAARGNARLKVGPVADKDETTVVGDIVTSEGSLVERYEVDKRSGIAELVP